MVYWQIVKLVKQRRGALWRRIMGKRSENIPIPTKEIGKRILRNAGVEKGKYALQINKGKGKGGWITKWILVIV